MSPYAEGTKVSVNQSQAEIGKILGRYGCDGMMIGHITNVATVMFRARDRNVRFTLALPTDADVTRTDTGRNRAVAARKAALESETRRRWRCLALAIKAKLEVVDTGIETFEEAFAVHTVMPDGRTLGEHVMPTVARAIESGEMPRVLVDTGIRRIER